MHRGDLPMMMRDNDRFGMAHGIETHVPFLDHGLVELSIALGDHHKYAPGTTKLLLRRALSDLLPEPVIAHSGKGSYSELEAAWIRGGAGKIGRLAMEKCAGWGDVFDRDGAAEICGDIARVDKASVLLLWRVIAFAAWAERFGVTL
jgi:asparagine synthase (glutamine-hydrolysing)